MKFRKEESKKLKSWCLRLDAEEMLIVAAYSETGETIGTLLAFSRTGEVKNFGSLEHVLSEYGYDPHDTVTNLTTRAGWHIMKEIKSTSEKRINDMVELGMVFDFSCFSYVGKDEAIRDFNVHMVEIQCCDDEEWDNKISLLKKERSKRAGEK